MNENITRPTPEPGQEVLDLVADLSAPFPRQKYVIRITEATPQLSKANETPMIKLQYECVAPEYVVIGKPYSMPPRKYQVAGLVQGFCYCMLGVKNLSNDKSGKNLFRKLEIPIPEDPKNPDCNAFKGMLLEVIGKSSQKEQMGVRYNETTGEPENYKIVDADGRPMWTYQFGFFFNADDIVRRVQESDVPTDPNKPY